MIFRVSKKLATKLRLECVKPLPLNPNPLADWSAHLFTADRTQYVILTNTAALYSVVTNGRGMASDSEFITRSLDCIQELLGHDGLDSIYSRLIAPASATMQFSTALNRSVTSSMNDLVFHAKIWLTEGGLSPFEASFKLNNVPMGSLDYRYPIEAFKSLAEQHGSSQRVPHSSENLKYLPEERAYPNLARLLRSGGHLEVGEDLSLGCFAKLRIGNKTLAVAAMSYRDFEAVLKEMDSQARRHFEQQDH